MHIHTGCGKSGIIALAPYILDAKRYLIIAPNLNIKDQLQSDVANFCHARGVISDFSLPELGDLTSGKPICVTNIQQRADIKIDSEAFDLVAIDEAHHFPAKTWVKIVDHFVNAKIIFLTATPFRSDAKEQMVPIFQDPINKFTYQDAIRNNLVKTFEPIYVNGADEQAVIKKVIEKLNEFPNQKAIAYCRDNKRAEEIMSKFEVEGELPLIINIHQEKRIELIEKLKKRDGPRIAIVNNMLGEGFDCPAISIAAIFDKFNTNMNTVSKIKGKKAYIQFVGRAVRKIPNGGDNQKAYIISLKSLEQKEIHDDYMDNENVDENDNDGINYEEVEDEEVEDEVDEMEIVY